MDLEILNCEQLMELVFEKRDDYDSLRLIFEYVRDNDEKYTVFEVFTICAMVLGSNELYLKGNKVKRRI